jgi:glycosyltransferase involved in cell wall biosynthesis
MRILLPLHVWHPEGRGGTEVHARAVAMALAGRGHVVGVFARTGRTGRDEYEVTTERDGPVGVTRVNNTWRDNWSFEWIYRNRRIHEAFQRELDEFRPDLVHIHHLTGLSTTIVEEIKARKLPLVMSLHDFWTVCPRGQRMTKDLSLCEVLDRNRCWTCLGGMWPHIFGRRDSERTIVDRLGRLSPAALAEWDRHMAYVLDLCDLLVTPSEFHRERMLEGGLDPSRVVALPHGLPDPPPIQRAPARGEVRRIVYLGAVIPTKGAHVLVRAFKALGRADIELHIHGEITPHHDDTDYGERLRSLAGDAPNIVLHGAYEPEDVHGILARADLLVVPSLWWETYCLTIREGLQAGVPVIASDLGAMREALDGERDGLLFEPGNPKDLRRVLERLIEDPELRRRYSGRSGAVLRLEDYLPGLLAVYEKARELARIRAEGLVVAPPSFPPERAAGAVPRFDRVAVAVRHTGVLAVAATTRPATPESPSVGISLEVAASGHRQGAIDVEVDLRGLLGARPPAPTAPPVHPRFAEEAGESVPSGPSGAPDRVPPGRHRLLAADSPRPRLRRDRIAAGRVRRTSWRPTRGVRTKRIPVGDRDAARPPRPRGDSP